MKKIIFLTLLLSASSLFASNILTAGHWVANASGSTGKAVKQNDGSWLVTKDKGTGSLVFTHHGFRKLLPEKKYLIEWDVMLADGQSAGTMVYLPRKPKARAPWPGGASVKANGKWQKVSQLLAVESDESDARLHLVISGNAGTAQVKNCTVTEVKNDPVLSVLNWVANPSDTVCQAAKLDDGSWEVVKKEDRGYVIFTHLGGPRKIASGKFYQISWDITADIGMTISSMIYLPRKPKPRNPWPTSEPFFATGKTMKVIHFLEVKPDESSAQFHLVIRGNAGKCVIKDCQITEITEAEYRKSQQPKLVEEKIFDGSSLKKDWQVFNFRNDLPPAGRNGYYFNAYERSGIICKRLNWQAADVKMIELAASCDQPVIYRMDFVADDNGKRRTSYLTYVSFGDGKLHDLRFEVGSNPSWVGTIKEVKITCLADGGKVGFERLHARKEDNLIPFAADQKKLCPLENIRPRGNYLLKNSIGATLTIFDRSDKIIFQRKIESAEMNFTAPEMSVRAELLDAPANASLTLLRLRPLELPELYWRGEWIWCQNGFGPNNTNVWFEKVIDIKNAPEAAQAVMTADDNLEFFINGKKVGDGSSHWATCVRFDIAEYLKPGKNSIVVKAHNVGAWGGFIGEIYVRENGVDRFYPTSKDWFCHIGGDTLPKRFPTPAFLLGAPPAPPWGTRTGYLYVGPKSRLQLVKSGKGEFTVKVLDDMPADVPKLAFRIKGKNGESKIAEGIVSPSTGKWKKGETVKVTFQLPVKADSEMDVSLASDFLTVDGDPVIAVLPPTPKTIPAPVSARVINTGSRPFIEINGEKYNPIYYDGYKTPEKDWMLRDAIAGGCRIVRTGIHFDTIWKAPGQLDFSALDHLMDSFALNSPDIKVILHVRLAMPQWWCDANPDEVVRYDRDQPIRPYQDRQALASKRWLTEASAVLRELIRYILKTPYADRIFAIGLAEGWNSEWFWTYADRFGQSAYSGYSAADYATFTAYLKERYKTDAAFAAAWGIPDLTFENFTIPSRKELDSASVITLLDPVKDRRIIDWYMFRNRSIGEAIEYFAKVVKEETANKWLVGVYYGYFQMFCGIYHRLQSVGHLDVERLARLPYVDLFWAPSNYNLRRPGLADGIMQAAENLSAHGKLVVIEQDMRTFCENDHYEAGRMRTVEMTVGAFERAFGLLLSRGTATHWLAMHESWFREKVLLDLMKHQQQIYASLPPVQGTTPTEICIVSDTASAFYTQHNLGDNPHRSTVYQLVANFNFVGAPFKHLFVQDLLEKDLIAPHKLYIMTNILTLSDADKAKLDARFEREKATVIWLYAAGISNENAGPSAKLMSKFLGIKFTMDERKYIPSMRLNKELGGRIIRNPIQSGPWFIPQSGFDKILAADDQNRPMLVKWQKGNVTNYFSVIMHPSCELLRSLAKSAGVHLYSVTSTDPVLAGNDVVFLHAASGGEKELRLPPNCKARAIAGPLAGEFTDTIKFNAAIGRTYGFLVEKQ